MFSPFSHFGLLRHLVNVGRFEARQAKESAQRCGGCHCTFYGGGVLVCLAESRHVLAERSLVQYILWC